MDFVLSFLLTFHSFTTPQYLLEACVHRFQKPDNDHSPNSSSIHPTQLRVCSILLKWLEIDFNSFLEDPPLSQSLVDFITVELLPCAKYKALLKKFDLLLKKQLDPQRIDPKSYITVPPPPPELPVIFEANAFDIADIPSVEVARQVSLIDFDLYDVILPKECVNQNWNKDKKMLLAPNITKAIERFNDFSNWVSTKIITTPLLKTRINVIVKFVDIAYVSFFLEFDLFSLTFAWISTGMYQNQQLQHGNGNPGFFQQCSCLQTVQII